MLHDLPGFASRGRGAFRNRVAGVSDTD